MNVEWRAVLEDPNYEVSSDGRVRRVGGTVLRPWRLKTGYLQVKLSRNVRRSVHRLVCISFHGEDRAGRVVNHINGLRDDNRADNLEWCTHGENMTHAYRVLGATPSCTGRFSGRHPTSKAVVRIDLRTGEEQHYASAMDAVREGFDSSSISRCCHGQIKTHHGFAWRFARDTFDEFIPAQRRAA